MQGAPRLLRSNHSAGLMNVSTRWYPFAISVETPRQCPMGFARFATCPIVIVPELEGR